MPGHVFVVQGRMEALLRDAFVVTTDAEFTIEPHWLPVLGERDASALRPDGWGEGERVHGVARGRTDCWFLDVSTGSLEAIMRGLAEVLDGIARAGVVAAAGRALPLVGVPVPGIGGGGLGEHAGAVIARLLETLHEAVRRHDLDVAVVATTPARFAAVQRERRLSGSFPVPAGLLDHAKAIAGLARSGELALFLGAGVSVSAGLPSWAGLIEEIRRAAIDKGAHIPEDEFDALGVLDQTELLHALLQDELETLVAERFADVTPALSHALLAGLQCAEAVTTNYDSGYETAVRARDQGAPIAVMPWEKPVPGRPWLLKLHGDAARPGSVVLTRGQFIGYDSRWRPVGSVFQALMMTRRLLVVGASLTDDNVLRLAHEVRALRRRHAIDEPLGYALSLGPPPLRARLWGNDLEWIGLEGGSEAEQARQLEILLDVVATHASHSSPYLLQPEFADLLNPDLEVGLADQARELGRRIASATSRGELRQEEAWRGLLAVLEDRGVPPA